MQVSVALRESTAKSLVILDEFGKGTATVSFNILHGNGKLHGDV